MPLADVLCEMRTAVQRDDASVVDHLHQNHHVSRSLHDQIVIVVEIRKPRQCARDTALRQAALLRSVGALHPAGVGARPPLRRQGRNSPIQRIHNQRRSLVRDDPCSPIPIVPIVNARLGRPLFQGRRFLVGKKRFPCSLFGSFQGRNGAVVPYSLQVRLTPWGAWRSRRVRYGRLGLGASARGSRLRRRLRRVRRSSATWAGERRRIGDPNEASERSRASASYRREQYDRDHGPSRTDSTCGSISHRTPPANRDRPSHPSSSDSLLLG